MLFPIGDSGLLDSSHCMTCHEVDRTISEARGYAELGLLTESWELIESLPPERRVDLGALAVRLLVCAGLGKWEMGAEIVKLFGPGHPLELREAAGKFHLARAVALCSSSDLETAHQSVKALSAIWPEGREVALGSPELEPLWD
jgi:hypothetical protein